MPTYLDEVFEVYTSKKLFKSFVKFILDVKNK